MSDSTQLSDVEAQRRAAEAREAAERAEAARRKAQEDLQRHGQAALVQHSGHRP